MSWEAKSIVICLVAMGLICPVIAASSDKEEVPVEQFANLTDVRRAFVPAMKEMDWSRCINSHGRKEETYTSVTTLWSDGSWSQSWWGNSRKNCGTVYAVPISDFIVERRFRYKEGGLLKSGKVVAVEISIICTNPNVGWDVCRRTVLNLVENGVNVPRIAPTNNDYGGRDDKTIHLKEAAKRSSLSTKMGRILSLKSTARKRFGADTCQYLEGASPDGRVRILLLGCKVERERRDITPQTMQ